MTVPLNDDTRESYVNRMKINHLAMAELHYYLDHKRSMWQQLFTWVQAEEIYGNHWDKLEKNT